MAAADVRALWEQASEIIQRDGLDAILAEIGLDPTDFRQWLVDDARDSLERVDALPLGDRRAKVGGFLATHAHLGFVTGYLLAQERIGPRAEGRP